MGHDLEFSAEAEASTAEGFDLNNPSNPLQEYYCLCCCGFSKSLQCVTDYEGHIPPVVLLLKQVVLKVGFKDHLGSLRMLPGDPAKRGIIQFPY